ncbi:bifunctional phosphoribosyl-AMP cyclohydrolase/phosphoribosyl-ATP diphosphatase HisIE [Crocinitomix algicola]|uniref:bifunctional phosphoribosyl-AMP cyclohydrolase/phosphoribosyl-ATP diphosphatase HisIE n=1 Tax=Crocinitomix algicola TaxID=1740263 RepID=UPI000829AF51|nr:bifunctional phosphoribosyl-AMP cyclohydrolase/phosphoribosyl-ATP diphosphatase HisIE [Crocinitomix algicola]
MNLNFEKGNGLIPVIIQHQLSLQVLMLGYMNEEALKKTIEDKIVTFYSRSKKRLWTKGESSGNVLRVAEIKFDCDSDTLLILTFPKGPTCHNGTNSCFDLRSAKGFLYELESKIDERINEKARNSYSYELYEKGINKIAQKVGEEAVELVIEAKDDNLTLFKNEAADLMYHFLLLLRAKNTNLKAIEQILKDRSKVK